MKFKVGDKVRVVRCRKKISTYVLEDCDEIFREDELELVQERQFTKTDLKKGDKCTLKNGAVIFFGQECNYRFNNLDEQLRYACNDNASIVKVERPTHYKTVFERKEEVLDATEKRYLAGVIRPFRDKVKSIVKYNNPSRSGKEYLKIQIIDDAGINFPDFKKDFMYKGMETDRKYTLEELEL